MKITILIVFLYLVPFVTTQCCPRNGIWSEWESLEPCSDHCGGCGKIRKNRTCLSQTQCGPCRGPRVVEEPCGFDICQGRKKPCCQPHKIIMDATEWKLQCHDKSKPAQEIAEKCEITGCCPEKGIWSKWASASCHEECHNRTCNAVKHCRTCLSDNWKCKCRGSTQSIRPCSCQVSGSESCCAGQRRVHYQRLGVTYCEGPNKIASMKKGKCCHQDGLGLWNYWSAWSKCTSDCGSCGTQRRTRICASEKYGCPCRGKHVEVKVCGNNAYCGDVSCCSGMKMVTAFENMTICVLDTSKPQPPKTLGQWAEWASFDTQNCGRKHSRRRCLPPGAYCAGNYLAMVNYEIKCCDSYKRCPTGYRKVIIGKLCGCHKIK